MAEPPPSPSPSIFRNPTSLIGMFLVVVATAIGLPLLIYDLLATQSNPYLGILIYMVLPAFAAFGAGLAALGALLERRRRARHPGAPISAFPVIDFNRPTTRRAAVSGLVVLIVIAVLLSVTGYQAYNFTDSVQFCGEVCHQVMKPEFTAYSHSPHARVACVACHVGPGAGWYMRSKLSGAYQVYSVTFHKYHRPIETPVRNLRPAPETCEQCHWPAKFFGAQQKTFTHFMADEKNSPWQIQALIKIGGGDAKTGASQGIHWHMNIQNDIYYIASDEAREVIPWVKAVSKDGRVTVYMSSENPLTAEQIARAVPRKMDCVDCHNRPSHIYWPPDLALDQAFSTGRLDPSLPFMKREGMRVLSAEYRTSEEARAAIEKALPEFYAKNYPAAAREKADAIRQATRTLQDIFATTIFPEMKTDWRVHPNHIGHLNSDGCFRCHDGLHKSADGRVITNSCNTCHTFVAQGPPAEISKKPLQAQPFKHPVDLGGVDLSTMKCDQCHNGTIGL